MDENKTSDTKSKSKWKKRLIVLCTVLVLLFTVIPFVLGIVIYNANFGGRIETADALKFTLEDFPGLEREPVDIYSSDNVKLGAWLYRQSDADDNFKGLIVTLHGMGIGGHSSEMNVINCFTKAGYEVLAFDASGTDDSEGVAGGFPQELVDADHVIDYVKSNEELNRLPLLVWGRSMGAYSGAALLKLHPEILGFVSVSGFNEVTDSLKYNGVPFFVPYVHLYEKIKWSETADIKAMDGFAASDARVMVVQGSSDTMVPAEAGWDIYKETYGDDARFDFVWVEGKGHMDIYGTDELTEYLAGINFNTVDQNTLDKNKFKGLNEELMNRMVEFYDECIKAR